MDTRVVAVFILALATAAVIRKVLAGGAARAARQIVNRLSWVLLALLALDTFSRNAPDPLVLGFAVLFVSTVSGLAYLLRATWPTGISACLTIATGTFGGGNRGIALMSAIATLPLFAAEQREQMIQAFLQIDVVVLGWLLLVTPLMLRHRTGTGGAEPSDSARSPGQGTSVRLLGGAPAVVMAIVLLSWVLPQPAQAFVAEILGPSREIRSVALLYLSLTYVFLTFALARPRVTKTLRSVLAFYVPRLAAAAIMILGAMALSGLPAMSVLGTYPFLAVALVFAMCPPSSLFNGFMETFGAPLEDLQEVADLNVATTVVFAAGVFVIPFAALLSR